MRQRRVYQETHMTTAALQLSFKLSPGSHLRKIGPLKSRLILGADTKPPSHAGMARSHLDW
jgi:hypothetical protein